MRASRWFNPRLPRAAEFGALSDRAVLPLNAACRQSSPESGGCLISALSRRPSNRRFVHRSASGAAGRLRGRASRAGCVGSIRDCGAGRARPANQRESCDEVGEPHRRAIGEPITEGMGETGLTHASPSPDRFSLRTLSNLGMTSARAAAWRASPPPRLPTRACLIPTATSSRPSRLCELPGIGEWTADTLLCGPSVKATHSLPTTWRSNDNSVPAPPPHRGPIAGHAERWRPWRAYAMLHSGMADSDAAQNFQSRRRMRLRLERWTSPLSPPAAGHRQNGILRALDTRRSGMRLSRLLAQHYGRQYILEEAAAPATLIRALDAYFNGEIDRAGRYSHRHRRHFLPT